MQESKSEPSLSPAGAQPATEATRACNHAQRRLLPLADTQSFDDARRGFIADKYGVLVDALYANRTEQYIETQVKFEDGRTGSVSATLKLSDAKTFTPVKAAA